MKVLAVVMDDRHRPAEVARRRAELSVQDLWLRYVALGGTVDAFDVDGYLQGLVRLDTFQQDVLAHAVNEALSDSYDASRVPLSTPDFGGAVDQPLQDVVERLLERHRPPGDRRLPDAGGAQNGSEKSR